MRRTPAVAFLFAFSTCVPSLRAQSASNIMRPNVPSPTAASLGKFGDVPVSYYTGVPEISVPLFTARGKTLDLPISLSYHASGIKVEEIGGWVGAGWALEAGGAITRTVRGIVDEQVEGYFNTGRTFYVGTNWTNPPATLIRQIHDDKAVDPEPDQFFFNFAGKSGEMVGGPLTANSSDPNVFMTIPYRKWRIVPDIGPDVITGQTIIRSWVVTTEDGTKYTFAAPEVHRDREYMWLLGYSDPKPYASAWYLTEIQAPGGDVITLQYADYNAEHQTGMYREQASNISAPIQGDCNGISGYTGPDGASKIFDVHNQTYVYGKRLTSITSAAHVITFSHSLRQDALSPENGDYLSGRRQQEPQLDLITVATAGTPSVTLKKFEFEYTYQGSLGGRLTLLNVYEEDPSGNRLPPYSFTYDGPTLPSRVFTRNDYHPSPTRTASFALDFAGYYNGATNNDTPIPPGTSANGNPYPGADRNPNFFYMKAGSLIRITYPTGGFNDFVYEANDYSNGGSLVSDPQNLSASASVTGTGNSSRDFTVGGLTPTVSGSLTVFVSVACSTAPCPSMQLFKDGALLNTWTRQPNDSASRNVPWQFTRGSTYTLTASTQGQNITAIAITAFWQEQVALIKKTGSGLRIAQVRADDGMGNVTVRKYSYLRSDGRSSGWLAADARYDYDRFPSPGLNGCSYYSRTSAPKIVLGSGPLIGYSVVTESLGVNGVFGNIQRTFTAGCDCANAARAGNYGRDWPALRFTTDAWLRGEQRSAAEYSAGGQVQRSVASTYAAPVTPFPLVEFRGLAVDVYSMWPGSGGVYYTNAFAVRTGLKEMTDQVTTVYDTTGTTSVTSSQHFTYGNLNHAQLTEITETNSDGTQRITRLKYPGDYASGGSPGTEAGALAAMQNVSATGAHMPGVVIERSVSMKTGTSDRIVQAEVTTFKEFLAGQFLPYRHYVLNSPTPIP
jgi:hypothetical protein